MNCPFAAFPITATDDPDIAQATLSTELSDLQITAVRNRDKFHFEMNGLHLGRTTLAFNQMATETELDAGVIEDAVIVSFSYGPVTSLHVDDEFVGSDRAGIVSPGRRIRIQRTCGSGVLLVRASVKDVENRLRETIDQPVTRCLRFDRSTTSMSGVGLQVFHLLRFLGEDNTRTDRSLGNVILRASFDDLLLDTILSMPNNYTDLLLNGPRLQLSSRFVTQAEDYMAANAAEPITMSNVVEECGCSRSTLFDAFRRFRGYTPMRFLEQIRLNAARQALLAATAHDTVTSIALRNGFSHLGRFSKRYRERFGESPSATIRKNQRR